MAVATTRYDLSKGIPFEKNSQASAADTAQTCSTPDDGRIRKVLSVFVAYSAAPTQTGVIITLNSSIAAAYDTPLFTGTANVRNTYWVPDHDLILGPGDVLDVLAPAAGGVITSAVIINCEVLS